MFDTPRRTSWLSRFFLGSGLLLASSTSTSHAQSGPDMSWYEGGDSAREASSEDSAVLAEARPHEPRAASHARSERFFGVGVSLAYGLPLADFAEDAPYTRFLQGALRPAFDLHYFVTPRLGFGLYAGPGLGFEGRDFDAYCGDGVSCRVLLIDAGAYAEYRQPVIDHMSAFVQLNLGYEHYRNTLSASRGGISAEGKVRAHGVGFGVTLGAEYDHAHFGVGPFFSAQLGSFRTMSLDFGVDGVGSGSQGGDLRTAMHGMLLFGLRGRFEL